MSENDFRVGDCVRVNHGVLDPDFHVEIGGWQGRITQPKEDGVILVAWDSVTLRNMGMELIARCERENLDWRCAALSASELSRAVRRDAEEDVSRAVAVIQAKLFDDPSLKDIFGP